MSQCDAREDSQCPGEMTGFGALSKNCSPSSLDPSILCIRHRSFTSLDTPDNCEADQGANSIHDLLIHYG